ncbi:MAG TPA: hypothetical protein ENJ00_03210 [Phycisphaerales bacterium]|nr:hypothetical protein [Phycisphaerales bacterium]
MKAVVCVVVGVMGVGCASERAIWQAQDNIIQNDNRIAEAISAQHESQSTGDLERLRAELDQLAERNRQINDRTEEIAEAATSAQSVAADAMAGIQAYLGSLGGPLGGVVGAAIDGIGQGLEEQDTRLFEIETETRSTGVRVDSIESNLDKRIEAQLLAHGMTRDQIRLIKNQLSPTEIMALLAVAGMGTSSGLFASRVGKSRSADAIAELRAKIEKITN